MGRHCIEMTGTVHGGLLVIGRSESWPKPASWRCLCFCGKETVANGTNLRRGFTKSCGCGRIKHGHASGKRSRTYESWQAMIARCYRSTDVSFVRYGAKGIQVCDRWRGDQGFANFISDMGERPAGKSLDRYPNLNGNYDPANCRWATPAEQARNRRCTKLEAHEPSQIRWLVGLGFSKASVGRFFGITPSTVHSVVIGHTWVDNNKDE